MGRAYYIDDIYKEGWDAVLESHLALDSVLGFEKQLNQDFPADKKYGYENRNNLTVRAYSREYSTKYHQMLDGMVERRMRKSIRRVGSYWYTAWKMAGSPDLRKLVNKDFTEEQDDFEKKLEIIDREAGGFGFWFESSERFFDGLGMVFGWLMVV